MESFAHHLTKIRESRGFTVNQLAMYSGISSASISRYESGERNPKPESVKKLSEALKYSYEELMKLAGHLEKSKEDYPIEETKLDKERKDMVDLIINIQDPVKKQQAIAYLEFLANSPTDGVKK
ncbi:MAG: transcriptional regulator [Bacilli bacterium]|nr:transcriptional regulator [Bacilli bacterium]